MPSYESMAEENSYSISPFNFALHFNVNRRANKVRMPKSESVAEEKFLLISQEIRFSLKKSELYADMWVNRWREFFLDSHFAITDPAVSNRRGKLGFPSRDPNCVPQSESIGKEKIFFDFPAMSDRRENRFILEKSKLYAEVYVNGWRKVLSQFPHFGLICRNVSR